MVSQAGHLLIRMSSYYRETGHLGAYTKEDADVRDAIPRLDLELLNLIADTPVLNV